MNVFLGQLVQGDLFPVRNQLRRALTAKSRKKRLVALADDEEALDETDEPKAPRRHETLTVAVYGHPVRALLDRGAIPNLISLATAQKIGIKIEQRKATIRVAYGDTAKGICEVRNLPVVFEDLVVPLTSFFWNIPSSE